GRIRLGGNHGGDELVSNFGTLAVSGGASIERLKASAGGGAFYGEKENPTRFICQPGGTLLGTGTLEYVNSTGSEKMKSLNLLNCGAIAPGEHEGKPGMLVLVDADVTFGNGAEKGAMPRGAGILRIDIAGTPAQQARFDKLQVSGTITFTAGAGNTLEIITPAGFTPSGRYRIATCTGTAGQFDVLRYNGKENVPYTVEYGNGGIDVIFK
ncbi:MAG TPA: hypothetical protein VM223_26930, partial [Planctomycetota bacterium]|nr:hypothetical protein [Planctomycetota bacterium]